MDRNRRNRLIAIIDRTVESFGARCVEVESEGSLIVRIFVEMANGTATVDECAAISKKLMDDDEFSGELSDEQSLEVSSPGLERPLRLVSDFAANVGKKVRVKLTETVSDRKAGSGTILGVSGEVIDVETNRGTWSFNVSSVEHANLEVDWKTLF